MTESKTYFRYCDVKSCGEKFMPYGKNVMICKKCKQKIVAVINLRTKKEKFEELLINSNMIEKEHKDKLRKIISLIKEEVDILNKELER
jgi:hypothetical protein